MLSIFRIPRRDDSSVDPIHCTGNSSLPDLATAHRQRLLGTLQRAAQRPRRMPGDLRAGAAVLIAIAVLSAVSGAIAAAQLADDIRAARAAAERCSQ